MATVIRHLLSARSCLFFFGVARFLTLCAVHPDPKTIARHVQLIQELKGRSQKTTDLAPLPSKAIDLTPRCAAQTSAYLKGGFEYLMLTKDALEKIPPTIKPEIKAKIPAIVDLILNRECENTDAFYVLYHGESMRAKFLQQLIKKIEFWKNLIHKKTVFTYLRTPGTPLREQTVEQFFKQEQPCSSDKWQLTDQDKAHLTRDPWDNYFDHLPHIKEQLLSTNITLFGNQTVYGESTFQYWLEGKSFGEINWEPILAPLGINKRYIPHLDTLFKKIEGIGGIGGNLLQIFIPKGIIDTYTYPAAPGGYPLFKPVPLTGKYSTVDSIECGALPISEQHLESGYTYKPNHFWKMSEIFKKLLTDPFKLDEELKLQGQNIDTIQARLLITPTINNPASGIKVYEYTLANYSNDTKKELESITNELNSLMDEIFADLIEHQAALRGTSVAKLLKYLSGEETSKSEVPTHVETAKTHHAESEPKTSSSTAAVKTHLTPSGEVITTPTVSVRKQIKEWEKRTHK